MSDLTQRAASEIIAALSDTAPGHWTVVSDAPQGSVEWLEARRGGIGASEAAAILHMNPWQTPLDVWLAKTQGITSGSSDAMEWGHRLEPVVRDKFAEARPRSVVEEVPGTLAHPDHPWMRASLDGLVHDRDGTTVLEIKTTRQRWDSEVPAHYIAQVQWQLAVTGLPLAHVAVLQSGSRYDEYTIEADATTIEQLIDYGQGWWNRYVVRHRPPPADPTRDTPNLARVWTPEPGLVAEIDPDLAQRVRDAKAVLAAAKTAHDEAVAQVQIAMGEATTAMCGEERVATWNARKGSTTVDRAALKRDGLLEQYSKIGQPSRTFTLDRNWAKQINTNEGENQ